MHEMSIALSILDIVAEQARAHGATVIRTVHADVGALAGVEIEALGFCFEVARKGTPADGAELVIREIPGRGRCRACATEVPMDFLVAVCPACDGTVEIVAGRELRVRSLDVD